MVGGMYGQRFDTTILIAALMNFLSYSVVLLILTVGWIVISLLTVSLLLQQILIYLRFWIQM